MIQPERPQMTTWSMRISCWVTKTTNTLPEYVMLIAFSTAAMVERRSVTLYVILHVFCWMLLHPIVPFLLRLGLPSVNFLSGFSTKTLYAFLAEPCTPLLPHAPFFHHCNIIRPTKLAKLASLYFVPTFCYCRYLTVTTGTLPLLPVPYCHCRYLTVTAGTLLLLPVPYFYCRYLTVTSGTLPLLPVPCRYCRYLTVTACTFLLLPVPYCYCRYLTVAACT